MFKKLYTKIDELHRSIRDGFREQIWEHHEVRKRIDSESSAIRSKLDDMKKVITSQQHTIEQLTDALRDKYEHGLFVISEYGKPPMVIKNGKDIVGEHTTSLSITWELGEVPIIETEQRG